MGVSILGIAILLPIFIMENTVLYVYKKALLKIVTMLFQEFKPVLKSDMNSIGTITSLIFALHVTKEQQEI
jgi:hypothetical protein